MNAEKAKKALAAVLLFHGGSPWDTEKRYEWLNLSVGILGDKVSEHSGEATTRNLCILVREALESPDLGPAAPFVTSFNDTPLEALLRLKRQLEIGIAIVESGPMVKDDSATASPFRFRVGDFGVYDFTGR